MSTPVEIQLVPRDNLIMLLLFLGYNGASTQCRPWESWSTLQTGSKLENETQLLDIYKLTNPTSEVLTTQMTWSDKLPP